MLRLLEVRKHKCHSRLRPDQVYKYNLSQTFKRRLLYLERQAMYLKERMRSPVTERKGGCTEQA